jgi:hypothetical protein
LISARAGEIEQARNPFADRGVVDAEVATEHQQVLGGRKVGIEIVELRHHADARACFAGTRRHRFADQRDAAAVGRGEAEAAAQGRGLARAVRAEQAEALALGQRKGNAGHHFAAAVAFVQIDDF